MAPLPGASTSSIYGPEAIGDSGEASYHTPRRRLWSAQACLRLVSRQLAAAAREKYKLQTTTSGRLGRKLLDRTVNFVRTERIARPEG
jgi:hypothetical protein